MASTARTGVSDDTVAKLHVETPEEEVKYRAALTKQGRPVYKDGEPLTLAYVTARYVADTLDEIVGPQNWQDSYEVLGPTGSVRCGIGILINGEWVWKFDVGVPSNIEPAKGAFSDAFKRAAVKWGVARDLYEERDDDGGQDSEAKEAPRGTIQSRLRGDDEDEGDEPEERPARGSFRPRQRGRGSRPFRRDGNARRFDRPRPAQAEAPQVNPDDAEWFCPDHDDFKIVPGGTSRRTGKEYGPFYACPVPGCDQRGPFLSD